MRRRRLVIVACLIAFAGCLKKAAYTTDGHGGYLLQTRASSLDQAMIRFQRTASDLCPNEDYALGEPVAGTRVGPDVTYDVDLDCTPP